MSTIEIEIDGKTLTAEPNETVMKVADRAGIYIPRFCYHKHLSIAANCRMCLVEVEKSPKALPACATPVMPGMKVFTKSEKTILAQRAVMEFLLINHPLDCPVCDQGGECELQDLSMGYGAGYSEYNECKRATPNDNLGPLISTEMTRCIYCTRCVRFGTEVAGMRELGATFRGEHTEISTFVAHAMQSEVSGNIIDLCPVGALTSKPYRFTARAWELKQAPSISPHDCWGSHLNVHTLYGDVKRVVSRECHTINETWISDRDRFSYTGLSHENRLKEPKIKVNGEWHTVGWEKALQIAAAGLREVVHHHSANDIAALASPSSTVEEMFLLKKLMQGLGSNNVDHRLRQMDAVDATGLDLPIAELENCDGILLIGSNLQKEQPLGAVRVRKAALKGASVVAVNPVDYDFNFGVTEKHIVAPHQLINTLQALLKQPVLTDKKKVCVLVGALALNHPQASVVCALARELAAKLNASIGFLTEGANALSANTAASAYELLSNPRKGYVLMNVDPLLDSANAAMAKQAIEKADFVVALSTYENDLLSANANVLLPMSAFTETSGTYVNVNGEWQSFQGVANPMGASRPAWKILRALGNFLDLDDFHYESSEEVKKDGEKDSAQALRVERSNPVDRDMHDIKLSRIGEIPIYAIDSLVRHAEPLQIAQTNMLGDVSCARIHPTTAKHYQIQQQDSVTFKQGEAAAVLKVVLDEKIAENAVWVAGGIAATNTLGDLFGAIEIVK